MTGAPDCGVIAPGQLTGGMAPSATAAGERPAVGEVDAVMSVAQLLVAIGARSLAMIEAEVSLPQLRVLVILASHGPGSLNALADTLGVHPSNATRACGKLVAAGLIRRVEDPDHRRLLALSMTAAGTRLVEKAMAHRRSQVEDLLSRVPARQRRTLASALRILASASPGTLDRAAWQAGWTTPK